MRTRLVLVLPLLLAGCGATSIDTEKGERFITKTVEDQVGARVKAVKCPEDLTAEKGATFTCTVTGADGTTGDVEVVQKDDKGNVKVSAPILPIRNLEKLMAQDIGQQVGSDVKLSCPEIITREKGATFDCVAASGKDKATVKVTQKDDKGNVNYKLQRQ